MENIRTQQEAANNLYALHQQVTNNRDPVATQTFRKFLTAKLIPLCHALGFGEQTSLFLEVYHTMIDPWGDKVIGKTPQWCSQITYDNTPFEISIALDGNDTELRLLVEPQGEPTTLASSWEAGCRTNKLLEKKYGICLERFKLVEDLFEPCNPEMGFSIWHAFGLRKDAKPEFKLYLNPFACGFDQAPMLIQEALERLGFTHARDFLAHVASQRQGKDIFVFFSLDLNPGCQARVKVYTANYDASVEYLESLLASSPEHVSGDARKFCEAMIGAEHPFSVRPTLTCFAFTSNNEARPFSTTLQLPMRDYIDNDYMAMQRICSFLTPKDRKIYEQTLATIAGRPLDAGVGMHTFASFKRKKGQPVINIYFSLEAYKVLLPRALKDTSYDR